MKSITEQVTATHTIKSLPSTLIFLQATMIGVWADRTTSACLIWDPEGPGLDQTYPCGCWVFWLKTNPEFQVYRERGQVGEQTILVLWEWQLYVWRDNQSHQGQSLTITSTSRQCGWNHSKGVTGGRLTCQPGIETHSWHFLLCMRCWSEAWMN